MNENGLFGDFIEKAGKVPSVRIDRETFLKNTFKRKYTNIIDKVVDKGPIKAGIPMNEIGKIADQVITNETVMTTATSITTGIPGGVAMFATIPADILQFYAHVVITVQKLMYLYGWEEDIFDSHGELDDATKNALILYIGAMFGIKTAGDILVKVTANYFSKGTSKMLLKMLPKIIGDSTMRVTALKIIKIIGFKTTTKFVTSIPKAIPVLGGVISGAVTFVYFVPMSKRLKKYLASGNIDVFKMEVDE